MKLSWNKALNLAQDMISSYRFTGDYTFTIKQKELVFEYAKKVPKGGVVVELGVAYGETAAVICYVAKHRQFEYHGVDDFSLCGSAESVMASLIRLGLSAKIHNGKTCDILWNKEIDLLILDAGHDENNIKADCEKWLSFVKKNGIVMFHDYEDIYDQGSAHWAVRHYADKYTKEWDSLEYIKDKGLGLKVFRKP